MDYISIATKEITGFAQMFGNGQLAVFWVLG